MLNDLPIHPCLDGIKIVPKSLYKNTYYKDGNKLGKQKAKKIDLLLNHIQLFGVQVK